TRPSPSRWWSTRSPRIVVVVRQRRRPSTASSPATPRSTWTGSSSTSSRSRVSPTPSGSPRSIGSVRTLVVIPTYNEADSVGDVLRGVRKALPTADVLVVDDASPDGTGDLVDALSADLGRVELLRREGKAGLGSAYR